MQAIPWPTLKPKDHQTIEKILKYWFTNEHQDIFAKDYAFQRYLWFEGGNKIDKQITSEFEPIVAQLGFDIAPNFLFPKILQTDLETIKKSIAIEKQKISKLKRNTQSTQDTKNELYQSDEDVQEFYNSLSQNDIFDYLSKYAKETRKLWSLSPSSLIALVLLFDQFPRNMYRSQKEMFLFSEEIKSILIEFMNQLCEDGDDSNNGTDNTRDREQNLLLNTSKFAHDQLTFAYPPSCERLFIYLCFLHFENEELVQFGSEGIEYLFNETNSIPESSVSTLSLLSLLLPSSKYHLQIIQKFGRYPHRNVILNRENTKEEEEFLRLEIKPFIEVYQETHQYLSLFEDEKSKILAHQHPQSNHSSTDDASKELQITHKVKRTKVLPTNDYFLSFEAIPVSSVLKKKKITNEKEFFSKENNSPSTKLNILMLHGYRQNASFLREKTKSFAKSLDHIAHLTYINGPIIVPEYQEFVENNKLWINELNSERKLCWFVPSEDNQIYEGLQNSIDFLSKIWIEKGPFDGIIGQSQGGVIASILSSLLHHKRKGTDPSLLPLKLPDNIDFQFIVNISGFASSPASHSVLWKEEFIDIPSIHVIGKNDTKVDPQRTLLAASYFVHPKIVTHDGKHFTPNKWPVNDILQLLIHQQDLKLHSNQSSTHFLSSSPSIIQNDEKQLDQNIHVVDFEDNNNNNNSDQSFEEKIKKALNIQMKQRILRFHPIGFLSEEGKIFFSNPETQKSWNSLLSSQSSIHDVVESYKQILTSFFSQSLSSSPSRNNGPLLDDLMLIIFSIRSNDNPNTQQRFANMIIEAYLFAPSELLPYILLIPTLFGWMEFICVAIAAMEKYYLMKENHPFPNPIRDHLLQSSLLSSLSYLQCEDGDNDEEREVRILSIIFSKLNELYDQIITTIADQLRDDELKLKAIKLLRKRYPSPFEPSAHHNYHDLIPTSSQIDVKLFVDHLKQNQLWPSKCSEAVPTIRSLPDRQINIAKDIAIKLNPLHVPDHYFIDNNNNNNDDHHPQNVEMNHKTQEADDKKDPLSYTKGKAYTLYRILVRDLRVILSCDLPLVRKNLVFKQQLHQHSARVSKSVWEKLINRPISDDVIHPRPRPVLPCTLDDLSPLIQFLNENKKPTIQTPFIKGTIVPDGRLDLCKQVVGPKGITPLLQSMKGNQHVSRLLLGNNIIGNFGASEIANSIRNHDIPNMNVWYLGGNEFDHVGIKEIASALEDDVYVDALWLKLNPVGPLGCVHLANMLKVNRHLTCLDLVNTGILDDGFITIMNALQSIESSPLLYFYAGSNGLTYQSAEKLRDYFASKSNRLDTLYISTNRIGDRGIEEISKGIIFDKNLKRFSVGSNRITNTGLEKFVDAIISSNHPIELLDFGYPKNTAALGELGNSIGDDGTPSLCKLIEHHPLRSLNVANNMISESSVQRILNSLTNNRTLTSFKFFQFNTLIDEKIEADINAILHRNKSFAQTEDEKNHLLELEFPQHIHDVYSVYRTKEKKSTFDPQNFESFIN